MKPSKFHAQKLLKVLFDGYKQLNCTMQFQDEKHMKSISSSMKSM